MKFVVFVAACAATLLGAAMPARCADGPARRPAADAVVVSASRADTLLQDMPLFTSVLTQADIEKSPARTLDQLLRNLPGLLVPGAPAHATDPTGHNIRFRGMDKKVLVLLDGVPVLDPFYATIQWFKLPLSSIERVEVVRGGGSSLWGNLAVGGVINIVSRRPVADDGQLSLTLGSMGTRAAALLKNVVLSDALSLSVSLDGLRTDGYSTVPPNLKAAFWPGRGSSSASHENFRLGVFFKPSADFGGHLRIGYHSQNERIGGYAFGENRQKSPDLQAGLSWRLGAGRMTASVYGQSVDFDKFNGAGCYAAATFACGAPVSGAGASAEQQAAPVLQYASSHDINTYRERGGSLLYSQRRPGWLTEWQLGLDVRAISGEDDQRSYRAPTAALPDVLRVQRANYGAGAQRFVGLFTQLKASPLPALQLTLAARVDRFDSSDGVALQTPHSNAAPPVAGPTTGGPVPDLRETAFDPSLSARYALGDRLDLRGSVYKAFRAPGLNNMYRSFGSNAISIANPLLGPETLLGREIGLDWRDGRQTYSATWFRMDVRDMVATYAITAAAPIPEVVRSICGADYAGQPNASCPGSVSFYTNGQDQRSSGIELSAKWTVSRDLELGAYLTRTRSVYTHTSTGDPTGVQLPLIPKVVAGGNISWRAGERWSHHAELRHSGAMRLSGLAINPPLRQGSYAVVNVSTIYRLSAPLELFASVVNLFDRQYTDAGANNPQNLTRAMPRAVTTGIKLRF